ncbi:glycosyltransferase family 4 protein [Bacillus niameyensis]|uniref:glycosyltransferase family 4 protein n=1 Tax=Bacillus niameyensis TaxID=1522308 RepID=UPI000783940D|nr:glycosyltransferase family 4 protein [Bacillus niameyensis]
MKDILLITNYWHFECEKASSRYFTLANLISESGIDLEVITSTFYHATKNQRNYNKDFLNSFPYKITLIHESGYKKNISLKRIISHREFANNVLKYLRKRKKPDVIYSVVPSLDVAYILSRYAAANGIKLIIDIQDLWPESFKMVLNIPVLSDLAFAPMKRKANKIYAAADEIIAVSQSFVNRALEVNNKCMNGHSVFLGIELSNFDQHVLNRNAAIKSPDEIWLAYVGTLSYSYDLISVIDAIKILKDTGYTNIKFVVMGDGPLRNKFEDYAKKANIKFEFTGKLNYGNMVGKLSLCDIAINPITKNSAASIINKHADYVAAALPILNTQESLEFQNLLTQYNAGLNCENNNAYDLADKLIKLCKDKDLRTTMGKNSRRLAEEKFDRFQTYKKIIEILLAD